MSKEKTPEEIVQEIINWEWNENIVEQGDRERLPQMIRDYAQSLLSKKLKAKSIDFADWKDKSYIKTSSGWMYYKAIDSKTYNNKELYEKYISNPKV